MTRFRMAAGRTFAWMIPALLAGLLSACAPERPPADLVAQGEYGLGASEAAGGPPAAVSVGPPPFDVLKQIAAEPAPLQWLFLDNAIPTLAGAGAYDGFQAIKLEATQNNGMHRIGATLPAEKGCATSCLVTVWIKAPPGTDAMFEMASFAGENTVDQYGVSYFNIGALKVAPNSVVTEKTQMAATIVKDGDWIKLSGPINRGAAGHISIVIGMVMGDTHVFKGLPHQWLVLGGVKASDR